MGEPMELDVSPSRGTKRKADGILEGSKRGQVRISLPIPKATPNISFQEPAGGEVLESTWNTEDEASSFRKFNSKASSLPFGQPIAFSSINGPTYITAQTLIQQMAYALSDKIFSYSPESFDLDVAVKS